MPQGNFRLAIVLGLLALAGPFAIDMYLPALPEMASDLGMSDSAAQITLMSFFLTFGFAQMIYGPWSDQVGRKLPIYFGMGLFLIASIGASMSSTAAELIAWRAVQGAGGAVAMVIPRAIIRDVDTGPAATRLMAMIMLVISVSPMLAPLAGSGVIALSGWRAVFGVIGGMALISLLLTKFILAETLEPKDRVRVNLTNMRIGIGRLIRDSKFMGLTLVGALGTSSFFIFLSSAPFVYTGHYGLSSTGFSLAFAVNAIGFFTASQLAGPLGARIGMPGVVIIGQAIFATIGVVTAAFVLAGFAPLWFVIAGLFLANAGLGLVIPSVMVMALDDHGPIAGLASSLGGTLQMTIGGLAIALANPFFDGTVTPMVVAVVSCAILGGIAAAWTLRRA